MAPLSYIPARTITALALASLLLLGAACKPREDKKQAAPPPRPPAPVVTAEASLRSVPVRLTAVGQAEALVTVEVKSQVNGEITQVHFTEGQKVEKGAPLFTIDPRPFKAALQKVEANLARNRALAKNARANAERYTRLQQDEAVSRKEYDQYRTQLESAEADIAADMAAVESARLQLSYASIASPISGRTGDLKADAGNVVKANDTPAMVVIRQISPIAVSFTLPERYLGELRAKLAAGRLTVQATPAGAGAPEEGEIEFLDNSVDPATGTIRLKATFVNKTEALWPGQFVDVAITTGVLPDSVTVPASAVLSGQQGPMVYVVSAESKAEPRQVAAGVTHEGFTVIAKGVAAGETVVTDGQMRLFPGAPVTVKKPGEGSMAGGDGKK